MHEIYIPDWHPKRLNELMGAFWATAGKMKKADAAMIAHYSRKLPKATGKRRVELIIEMAPRQRCADVDAHWKSTLDSLVQCGMLKDDNTKWCEISPVQFIRGKTKSTRIRLYDN